MTTRTPLEIAVEALERLPGLIYYDDRKRAADEAIAAIRSAPVANPDLRAAIFDAVFESCDSDEESAMSCTTDVLRAIREASAPVESLADIAALRQPHDGCICVDCEWRALVDQARAEGLGEGREAGRALVALQSAVARREGEIAGLRMALNVAADCKCILEGEIAALVKLEARQ